ncbi:MAG: hypothetical protein E6J02_14310 [Chloroflexi bacterium]|nr:MAG: hypothetical protein E6J02_14310 [Chloroflexota bacterium]
MVAWATSKGVPLYGGVYDNSPPGIYWLYRLLLLLGAGRYHLVVQVAATLAVVAAALLTFEITRQLSPPWPAALAGGLTGFALSVPTLDGDLLNVELAALPLFLAALRLAFTGRVTWAFLAGGLLALAVATRPSFAFDGLALLVPLGLDRRLVAAAAGGVTALAAVLGALWIEGSLVAFFQVVLPADRAYGAGLRPRGNACDRRRPRPPGRANAGRPAAGDLAARLPCRRQPGAAGADALRARGDPPAGRRPGAPGRAASLALGGRAGDRGEPASDGPAHPRLACLADRR